LGFGEVAVKSDPSDGAYMIRTKETNPIIRVLLISIGVLCTILSFGCGQNGDSPEQRIRDDLTALEQAAEEKDLGTLKGAILDSYNDNEGYDKKSVTQLIRLNFLRQQSIHLLTRIKSIELTDVTNANAVVYVAMAGRPLEDTGALVNLSADLFRFQVELVEQGGEWKVARAQWRRATPDEFL
jgi:hypothetical protein